MQSATPRSALVTGSAGFIGYHLAARLLGDGWRVVGIDALTDYYDVDLKRQRHAMLEGSDTFTPVIGRIETPGLLDRLLAEHRPEVVIHLAAQAGVRHSITHPESYVDANLTGSFRLLEAARRTPPAHLLLASTSSVYGANPVMPHAESARADRPMSFYAATKQAMEAMAHSYAHLYALPVTAFRFFTVYGPWGRPDMAPFKFTRAILEGQPIDIYNHGEMARDFTYIDDLVEAVTRLIKVVPPPPTGRAAPVPGDSLSDVAPFRVVNIGNSSPVPLMDFIAAIEAAAGTPAIRNLLPMQPGDVPATWADTRLLRELTGHGPQTDIRDGIGRFVDWYRGFYGV